MFQWHPCVLWGVIVCFALMEFLSLARGPVPRAPECFHISFVKGKAFLSEDALKVALLYGAREKEKEKAILQKCLFSFVLLCCCLMGVREGQRQ
jgi:hypothetical protein